MGISASNGLTIVVSGLIGFLVFRQFVDSIIKEDLPIGVFVFVHHYAFLSLSLASFFRTKLVHKLPQVTLKK